MQNFPVFFLVAEHTKLERALKPWILSWSTFGEYGRSVAEHTKLERARAKAYGLALAVSLRATAPLAEHAAEIWRCCVMCDV